MEQNNAEDVALTASELKQAIRNEWRQLVWLFVVIVLWSFVLVGSLDLILNQDSTTALIGLVSAVGALVIRFWILEENHD